MGPTGPSPLVFALLLGVMGCAARVDVEAERKALLETDVRFSRVSEERGPVEAFHAFLTEDAIQLPHRADPIRGREAIWARMSEGPAYGLRWTPEQAVVSKAGDLGYTWGRYEATSVGGDSATVILRGKYVNVWRKEPDGSWKVIVDMGNQDPVE